MGRDEHDYVEAQIHEPLELANDVEALILDPSLAGTPVAEALQAAAERYGFAVETHESVTLALDAVPRQRIDGIRRWQRFCADGQARAWAERVGPQLDAASIGAAAARWGDRPEVLMRLKDLWQMTIALGEITATRP
jgi:hypothetical protein